ncbi:c-type cytochrome [Polaromonas sp. DSR2-3-2]|uniref:c-type cytochrome n=1 Tax=unclassified Polaromonas TaxID=2638319 RepID=UPI003CEBD69F
MNAYKLLPLVLIAALAACGEKAPTTSESTAPAAVTPAATAPVTQPAPTAAVAPPTAAAKGPAPSAEVLAQGEKIYTATCLACHGAGVLGAPKFGDKALWAPRIAKGMDTLYTNSINGINMMPARGGNAALKDDEMKAAVDYMVSKAN